MFLASLSYNVLSHSGRSDNQGGHFNRSTNQYHCHKEPCFSTHEQSKSALQDANDSNRAYSIVYNRTDWPHWIDEDKDCQNTRAEILIYHSAIPVTFQKDNHCTVKSGRWTGVYTGQVFTNASDIDIDHIDLNDKRVYDEVYKTGNTTAVFQMESYEAMDMCVMAQADNIEDVIHTKNLKLA